MSDDKSMSQNIPSTVQVVSVVVGVVISVMSFNNARESEAKARELEAARPFYTLRQNLYSEAVKTVGVLVNPEDHTKEELSKASTRFRELYVAELSMVEAPDVEKKMRALAEKIDPKLVEMTDQQKAAYHLAHALRDTFANDWKVNEN